MNITTALNLLPIVGSIVARAPEFIALYEAAIATLNANDQAVAKDALGDIQADNDEGHARLQAKLAAAARS